MSGLVEFLARVLKQRRTKIHGFDEPVCSDGTATHGSEFQLRALFHSTWYLAQHPDVAAGGIRPLQHYLRYGGAEGREPHPLFDSAWYRQQHPELTVTPLEHYVSSGMAEGANPNPLFDSRWYLDNNPDVAAAGAHPLEHYWSVGADEGRDPHPLFCSAWYRAQYPETTATNPLEHYLRWGVQYGSSPHPLFCPARYSSAYNDVAASGLDPLTHFLLRGGREGRDPHPLFDASFYLAHNPDVAADGANPLEHYLRTGAREARDPHPLFSTRWYLDRNADVGRSKLNPLVHYVIKGAKEGRAPHPLFDPTFYLSQQADSEAAREAPLLHYLAVGWKRGLRPHPRFDPSLYLANYPDAQESGVEPLTHYVSVGCAEGRVACAEEVAVKIRGVREAHAAPVIVQEAEPPNAIFPEAPDQERVVFEPLPSTAKVVVSVLFYQREDIIARFLFRLLPQIAAAAAEPDVEVQLRLTFNYAPTLAAREEIERLVRDDSLDDVVLLVENGFNLGFGAGHNAAFEDKASDVFVVLNSDVLVGGDAWLRQLVERFRSSSAAIVGPTTNAAHLRDDACGIPAEDPRDFDYLDGSLLAIRSEAARRFGLFAEDLQPFYFEDADLCLRYRQIGLSLAPLDLACEHERSSSARLLPRYAVGGVLDRNRALFFERWGGYLRTRELPNRLGVRFLKFDREIQMASLPAIFGLLADHPTAVLDISGLHEQLVPLFNHARIRLIPAWQSLRKRDYARFYEVGAERGGEESVVVAIADRFGCRPEFEATRRHLESLALSPNGEAKAEPQALIFVPRREPFFDGRDPAPDSWLPVGAVLAERGFAVEFCTDLGSLEVDELTASDGATWTHIALASGLELSRAMACADLVVSGANWISMLAQLLGKRTFVWLGAISAVASALDLTRSGFFADRALPCLGCSHRFAGDDRNFCLRGDVACMRPELTSDVATALVRFLDGETITAAGWEHSRVRKAERRSLPSAQLSLEAWPRSTAGSVLVLIAANPLLEQSHLARARDLAHAAIDGMRDSRVVLDSEGEAPLRGRSHPHRQEALAAIRQGMIDRHLRDDQWVFWVDSDIVAYSADLIDELIARAEGGIAAPLVLMEGDASEPTNEHGFGPGRFYDIAGFVENGRWARFTQPFFDQPGPVYQLDSVGSCYLVNAELYRHGAKHTIDLASRRFVEERREWNADVITRGQLGPAEAYTEHYSVCDFARRSSLPVRAFADLIAYHEKPHL